MTSKEDEMCRGNETKKSSKDFLRFCIQEIKRLQIFKINFKSQKNI